MVLVSAPVRSSPSRRQLGQAGHACRYRRHQFRVADAEARRPPRAYRRAILLLIGRQSKFTLYIGVVLADIVIVRQIVRPGDLGAEDDDVGAAVVVEGVEGADVAVRCLHLNSVAWGTNCAARRVQLAIGGPGVLQKVLMLGDFDGVWGCSVPLFSVAMESLMLISMAHNCLHITFWEI